MGKLLNRCGEIGINTYGTKMKIIYYEKYSKIRVKFLDEYGYETNAHYQQFKNGRIKNYYDKSACGVGFIGLGKYKASIDGVTTEEYNVWKAMMQRCYDAKCKSKHVTYGKCTVDEIWHNFQKFAEWYNENYYEVDGQRIHLDKDILVKGNKIYSPKFCVLVPHDINALFTKCDSKRGNLPIGVDLNNSKYRAKCRIGNGNRIHLGLFDSPELAFNAYKKYKENYIKKVADFYKDQVPKKLYDAMYKYEVEITD